MRDVLFTTVVSILSAWSSLFAYIEYDGTMNDFMGVNVHAQLYFHHYNGDYEHYDMSQPFRWVRNYHPWGWFEPQNDTYHWNFTAEGGWKWFDNYYQKLNQDSINILICLMGPPDWVTTEKYSFHDNGDGSAGNHYREAAEYMAQLTARYGPSGGLADDDLETSDKIQGLDYARYFEDSNEPNQWWEQAGTWHPQNYGVYLSAVHDGNDVSIDASLPIAGVKQGDAQALHVMGGFAGTGLDPSESFNGSYLDTAIASAGKPVGQVLDVINYHQYWNTTDSIDWPWTGAAGVSPENGIYERGDSSLFDILRWRDQNAPGIPVWLTEFGWDTYTAGGTDHSYQYAPELQQANYIMRSFALLRKEGIDKAFVYFDQDPNSTGTTQYSSSGLVKDVDHDYERKTSFFYVTTMRRAIGDYHFSGADVHAEGDPQMYVYRYTRTPDDIVLMVWCRKPQSLVDDGTTVSDYRIDVPSMLTCTQIVPEDGSLDGIHTPLTVSGAGTEGAHVMIPEINETPQFLRIALHSSSHAKVNDRKTGGRQHSYRISEGVVSFSGIPPHHRISVIRPNGRCVWRGNSQKSASTSFSLRPGLFIYSIQGAELTASGTILVVSD
ncbi:MAG: hypothetical protein ACLFSB_09990 [Chitinispirillaceae bacterium]